MPLIYSFVARERTVLAEYTPYSGNFKTLAVECLNKMSNPEARFTVACDRHTFNFVVNDGFAYLVVADEAYGRMIPFAFLARVKEEFEESYASKASTAPAHSLDRTFGPRLKTHMEYCMAHPEEISKLAAVQKKVEQVKGVMVQNVEKVLQRGDKIEVLVDKADELRNQAGEFQRKGKMLRSKMWYQNMKARFAVCCLILVLGIVIFLAACFTGNNCLAKKHTHEVEDGKELPPSPESPDSPHPKKGGHDRRLMSGIESAAWMVLLGRL